MGLFSKKGKPSSPGSYRTAWPQESGLGVGPYQAEADAQDAYLLYTSARRQAEPVPREDMPVMQAANALLYELSAGTPVNELPLIQGPIDVNWMSGSMPGEFAAEALITDRRVLVWWPSMRGIDGQLVVLHHFDLIPRSEPRVSVPLEWMGGMRIRYPIGNELMGGQLPRVGGTFRVHFSSDGHANRRSMSVQKTLHYLEDQVRAGVVTPDYRL